MVAWSVNSSSSVHCISLTATSLCSFVIANASLAWGATDSLAAGTREKKKTRDVHIFKDYSNTSSYIIAATILPFTKRS